MKAFLSWRTRPDERLQHHAMHVALLSFEFVMRIISGLVELRHPDLFFDFPSGYAAWIAAHPLHLDDAIETTHAPKIRNFILSFEADDRQPPLVHDPSQSGQ